MFSFIKDKSFLKKFFIVSFPVMLHALLLFIVNFVDNVMVSQLSNEAVSAVYAANQATYIFLIASYGVLIGAGVFIQQFNGAKDDNNLKQAFCYKLVIISIFLVIFITIYYLFGHNLIYLYSYKDSNCGLIYDLGNKYLNLMILSYIPFCFSIVYTTTVREIGATKYALIAGFAAFLANILFNYIFIFELNMGVAGAAIGTIIARCIELIFIVVLCHAKKFSFCHKLFKTFYIDKVLAKKITKKGIVFLANELFWVIGMTLLSLAYAQRENVLSSLSVVNSISNIFNIIFQGLSIGIGVMVGTYLGESKFKEAKDYAYKVYWLGFFTSIICGLIIIVFSPIIPNLFKEISSEQKSMASMMLVGYGMLLFGSCLYCCCYVTLKTGGEAVVTFMLDSGLMWLVAVPLAWGLALFTNISLLYIFMIITGIDFVKFLVSFSFVRKDKWLKNLTLIEN